MTMYIVSSICTFSTNSLEVGRNDICFSGGSQTQFFLFANRASNRACFIFLRNFHNSDLLNPEPLFKPTLFLHIHYNHVL